MGGLQGKVFGEYQLTEQIGSGTIAEVYRARPRAGGRDVAVKIVYPEFAQQPYFAPTFTHIRETAQALANHPHILPLLGADFQGGYAYLVTPLVEAGTLRDWLRSGGRLGESDAGPFYRQLCGALAYAHSLGAVHGNLKPSNIFLYEGRHVLLGDFGLLWDIRMLEMGAGGTGVEAMSYFAPEAFERQITQASDVYSLGAVLFATITGQPPFSPTSLLALREAHLRQQPPRLVDVVPTLRPPLPELDSIVQRAMAKRPEQRFASAMQITQAVDLTLRGGAHDVVGVAPGSFLPQMAGGQSGPGQQGMGAMGAPAMPGYAHPGGMAPGGPAFAPGMPGMAVPPGGAGPMVPGWGGPAPMSALAAGSPPFPPLPQSQRVDPQMEIGHGPSAGGPQPPQTPPSQPRQGPLPDEFLTARIPARGGWGPGTEGAAPAPAVGMGGSPNGSMNAPLHMPAIQAGPGAGGTPAGWARGLVPATPPGTSGSAGDALANVDWEDERAALPHSAAQRPATPFSATKLGLPRLTTSALGMGVMGGGPSAQDPSFVRAAAGYTSTRQPAVRDGESGYDTAYSASYPATYTDEREAERHGRSRWGDSTEDERYGRSDARGGASYPEYTDEHGARHRDRDRRGRRTDDYGDSREQSSADRYADSREDSAWDERGRRHGRRDDRYGDRHDERRDRRHIDRRRDDHYDDGRGGHRGGAEQGGSGFGAALGNDYAFGADLAAQAGANQKKEPARKTRRGGPLRVVALVAVLLIVVSVGAAGALYMRPTLCTASVCSRVVSLEQSVLPGGAASSETGGPAGQSNGANLDLTVPAGGSTTTNVTIHNPDNGPQSWNSSSTLPWLTVSPATGTLQANSSTTLVIKVAPTTVTPGTYTGTVILRTGGQNTSVGVKVTVTAGAKLAYTPKTLSVATCGVAQTITITNSGVSPLTYSATASSAMLTLTPTKATIAAGKQGTLSATLACTATHGKTYGITLTTNGGNGAIAVQYP